MTNETVLVEESRTSSLLKNKRQGKRALSSAGWNSNIFDWQYLNRARLVGLVAVALLAACGQASQDGQDGQDGKKDRRELSGQEAVPPSDFLFVGRSSPCWLEVGLAVDRGAKSLRVNCFHIDGVLHIHSNRFAKMPRTSGESWVEIVRRDAQVRIGLAGKIYPMVATPIDDEKRRIAILHDRGYWYAWDGITIFGFAAH